MSKFSIKRCYQKLKNSNDIPTLNKPEEASAKEKTHLLTTNGVPENANTDSIIIEKFPSLSPTAKKEASNASQQLFGGLPTKKENNGKWTEDLRDSMSGLMMDEDNTGNAGDGYQNTAVTSSICSNERFSKEESSDNGKISSCSPRRVQERTRKLSSTRRRNALVIKR